MEQIAWYEVLAALLTAVGGLEFIKWLFNRNTEQRLNSLEVKQQEFELDASRIAELHESMDKANELNDNLLARLSTANAAIDKHIDRNRELSDRLYKSELEVNRVNNLLTAEQSKTASYEKRIGELNRLIDHYKEWRCEKAGCTLRQPPNLQLKGKVYALPAEAGENNS